MGLFDFLFKSAGFNKQGDTQDYKEEFSAEMYSKVSNTDNMPPYNSYSNEGININQTDNPVTVTYNGILAKNGAQKVYAVIGYGDNAKWENTQYHEMNGVSGQTFEARIPVVREGNINLAFKDNLDNWDNNSGQNYTFNNHFYSGSQ